MFKRNTQARHHAEVDWSRPSADLAAPLHLQALEPRVLLDAAAAATAMQHQADMQALAVQAVHDMQAEAALVQALAHAMAPPSVTPPAVAPHGPAVYFIDAALPDTQQLVAALPANAEVHYIEPGTDGVKDIAQALQGRTGISAIHIVGHGSEGVADLGTATLTTATMQGAYRDELAAIGRTLTPDGDILLYACDFGAGADGLFAAQMLGSLTQADIAASTDLTGTGRLGGDWQLELHIGTIDAQALAAPEWNHLLVPGPSAITVWSPTDTTADGTNTATVTQTATGGIARTIDFTLNAFDGPGDGAVTQTADWSTIAATSAVAAGAVNAGSINDATTVDVSSLGGAATNTIGFTHASGNAVTLIDPVILISGGDAGSVFTFTDPGVTGLVILQQNGVTATVTGNQLSFATGGNLASDGVAVRVQGSFTSAIHFTATSPQPDGAALMSLLVGDVDVAGSFNQMPAAQSMQQAGTLVLSGANAIQVVDVDGIDPTGVEPIITVTLTATGGTMNLTDTTGLSFTSGDGLQDATLSFSGTRSAVNAALNGLTYTGNVDFFGTGAIDVQSTDANSPVVNSTSLPITLAESTNHAPVLSNLRVDGVVPLADSLDPPVGAVGLAVTDIANDINITDQDAGAVKGIAINTLDTTLGTWWYSIDNGANWSRFGAISYSTSLLLAADNSRIYLQSDGEFGGRVDNGFTFRAWDQTTGVNGTRVDTNANGGTHAFSIVFDTVAVDVLSSNLAPGNTLPASFTTPEDTDVALTGLSVTDTDAGATDTYSIALTVGSGTLNATAGGGVTVTGGGTTSLTLSGTLANINAFLAASAPVYTPVPNFNGSVPLTMLTNDGAPGAAQTDSDTSAIVVTPVNDAPVLDPTPVLAMPGMVEDSGVVPTGAAGVAVSSLLTTNVTDIDVTPAPIKGMAITGADATNGTWYYSTNGGSSWQVMGAVSDASALLLSSPSNSRICFRPNANFTGTVDPVLTFRAWDATSGTLGSKANTTPNGGTTAFSIATDTLSIAVSAVNDPPVNGFPAAGWTAPEDTQQTLTGLSVSDVDAGAANITVRLSVPNGFLTAFAGNGVTVGGNGTTSILLTGTAADITAWLAATPPVYSPPAEFSGTAVLTMVSDDAGNTGTGGAKTDTDTINIVVTAVDDPPVITLTTNLLTNGSFESGSAGWTSNTGGVETNPSAFYGVPATPDGTRVMEVEGSANTPETAETWDETSVPTIVGETYRLSFIAVNRAGHVGDSGYASIDGVKVLPFVTTSVWTTYSISFTATSTSTVVRITSTGSASGSGANPLPGDGEGLIVDDVQVHQISSATQTTWTEDGPAVAVAPTPLITDADSANMVSARLVITNAEAGDELLVQGALPAGITASYDAATFTLTLTGSATKAAYDSAIQNVYFQSTSQDPPAGLRDIAVTVNDGTSNSNTAIANVLVEKANDPPVNTLPPTYGTGKDQSLALTGLSVADPDVETGEISVTLSVTSGTLTGTSGAGVTVTGSGTASLSLTGTLASINAFLASAAAPLFVPAAGSTADVTLTMLTNDGGNTGTGGALTDTDIATITILADGDGDGSPDSADIDDDNDGILDVNESSPVSVSFSTATSTATPVAAQPITMINDGITTPANYYLTDDITIALMTFSFAQPTDGVRAIQIYNNGGNNITDGESMGAIGTINVYDANNQLLYSSTAYAADDSIPEGAAGRPFTIALPGLNGVSRVEFVNVRSRTNGSNPGISVGEIVAVGAVDIDTDGDGVPDRLDLDSDNDGITDNVEAQASAAYIAPSGQGAAMVDADGDGLDDNYDANTAGADRSVGLVPVNTDATAAVPDAIPDVLDPDSDNDGTPDIAERGDGRPTSITSSTDTDGDGLLDIFEGPVVNNGYVVTGANLTGTTINLLDSDADAGAGGASAVPMTADFDFRDAANTPFIDLNSPAIGSDTARNNTVNYSDGQPPVNIATATAGINDVQENDLASLHIAVAGTLDGANEIVNIGGKDFALNANSTQTASAGTTPFLIAYTVADGFTITRNGGGVMTPADLALLVRGITYRDTLPHATEGSRTLTFTLTDSTALASPDAVATIVVTPANNPPVAVDDTLVTNEDTPLPMTLAANDTDVDGDTLSVYSINGTVLTPGTAQDIVVPNGHVTVSTTGVTTVLAGTFAIVTPQFPLATLTIGSTTFTTAELQAFTPAAPSAAIAMAHGTLQVIGFDVATGTLDYRFTLTSAADHTAGNVIDTINLSLTDSVGNNTAAFPKTLAIEIVDDVPTATGDAAAITENAAPNTVTGNVETNDVPGADGVTTTGIVAGLTPAAGNVAAPVAGNFGSVTMQADGSWVYTLDNANPFVDALGTGQSLTDTFTYQVTDADGDVATAQLVVTINGANDAPVNTVPGAQTVDEDTVLAFTGPALISVNDVDRNIATTRVSVAHGTLNLTPGGATVVGGALGTGSITLSGTQAFINASLATLTYQGLLDFNGTDTLTIVSTDSDGTPLSDTDTVLINVTPVNDAPVNTVPGAQAVNEDTPLAFTGAATISVNDVDGNLATTQLSVNSGTLTVTPGGATISAGASGSATLTLSGTQAQINAALATLSYQGNANFNGTDTLTVLSTDGGAPALTDSDTIQITVNPINDAPVNTLPATGWTTNEDTTLPLTGIAVTDVDSAAGPITVQLSVTTGTLTAANGTGVTVAGSGTASIVLSGTVADINAYLASAAAPVYVPVPEASGPVTLSMITSDAGNSGAGGPLTDSDTALINVVAINDAPVNTLPLAGWTTDEDVPVVLTGISALDIDAGLGIVTVQLSVNSGTLSANNAGNVAVTGSGTATILFTGTLPDINAYLASLEAPVYTPALNATGGFVLTMVTDDLGNTGAGGAQRDLDTTTVAINVGAQDDPPVNTLPAAGWTTNEDTAIALTGLSIADVDAGLGIISVQLSVDAGTLTANDFGNITVTNSGTSSITLTGRLIGINLYLASAAAPVYHPAADANGTVTLTMLTNDNGNTGTGGPLTDTDTALITINPVNDAPINTLPAAGWTTNEDTAVALTGLAVADVDAAAGTITVQLGVDSGTLTAANGAGVTVANSGSASLTLSGTLADINAYLASAAAPTYTPVPDANGAVTLTLLTNDGGNTGVGGPLTDADTATINITPVNDAPVHTVPGPQVVNEDTPLAFTGAALISVDDLDGNLATTQLTVANGTLTVDLAGGATVSAGANGSNTLTLAGTQAQINAALATLRYQGHANFNGSDSLSIVSTDTGAPILGDGDTIAITVTPVNDAPVAANDGPFATAPNTPVTGNVITGTPADAGADFDIDLDALAVTQFTVDANGDGTPEAFAPGTTAKLTSGTGQPIGTLVINADGGFVFTPAPGYDGPVPPASYIVSDGNATGTATLSFNAVPNTPPVTQADVAVTDEDTPLSVPAATGLLANDSDADGDALAITDYSVAGLGSFAPGASANIAGIGVLTINADGSYAFVPAPDYNGPVPAVSYTMSDGSTARTGTLALSVTPVNDVPAVGNGGGSSLGGAIIVDADSGLLAGATDIDGDDLVITSFTVDGVPGPIPAGTPANIPGVGVLTINPDGSYSFVPDNGFSGPLPKTSFTVSDGEGGTATGELSLDVIAQPQPQPPAPLGDAPVNASFVFVYAPGDAAQGSPTPAPMGSVSGAVLGAVADLGNIGVSTLLGSDNVILNAVNDLASLNGTHLTGDELALGSPAGYNAISHAAGGNGGLGERFGGLGARASDTDRLDFAALGSGSSLRLMAAPGRTDVVLEMQTRGRQIWIGVDDTLDTGRSPIQRVDVTLADGRPLPPWIRVDASGLILIEAPAGTEMIGLRITVLRRSGESHTHTVDVDTGADQLQQRATAAPQRPANGTRADATHHDDPPRDFATQLAQASRRPAEVDAALLEALA
ncbi:tandem-95 repeat protein [Variovorax robiniae]|uniref:Tandem-95 repeat protein n=1 Tax=Variovorax robiniae TaxID=1836199 RepID=A0ABU8X9N1_9BURK